MLQKKRVIGEEAVGFSKGYNGNFGGFDPKNGDNYNHYLALNHGGFSSNHTINNGSEVHIFVYFLSPFYT